MHIFVEQKSRKQLTLTMLVASYAVMYAHTTLTNVMLNAIPGKCLEKRWRNNHVRYTALLQVSR